MPRGAAPREFFLLHMGRGRYGPLLLALLALCVAAPVMAGRDSHSPVLDAAMSCIVLTGLFAADPRRRSLVVGFALAALTLAIHRLVVVEHSEPIHVAHYGVMLLILAYTAREILHAVVRDRAVTVETIKGAVCVYFLIALIFVYVFVMIDIAQPGSFRIEAGEESRARGHLLVRQELHRLLYLSFCTLTTLGYGDIVPLRAVARTACYLEAVVGQVFLTVLVARLVGMHISRPAGDED